MKPTFFKSPVEFRAWLEANHHHASELLLGFRKKESGKGGITYAEALDEALCFGWIDGVRRRFDEESYTIRFSPRKPGSIWSAVNIKRVGELTKLGRMHSSGRKTFARRDQQKANLYSYEWATCKLEGEYEKQFRANKEGVGVLSGTGALVSPHRLLVGGERQAGGDPAAAAGETHRRLGCRPPSGHAESHGEEAGHIVIATEVFS